jgi:sugar lactone lactonase YvrE
MNTRIEPNPEISARVEETLRVLANWFDEDAPGHEPADLLSATLWRTSRTRRRGPWRNPERWFPVTLTTYRPLAALPSRLVVAVLLMALLAVAFVSGAVIVGSRLGRVQAPTESPNAVPAVALLPTACPTGSDLTSGTIATVAGDGLQLNTGDGGQASLAGIDGPYAGVAVDSTGELYITDSETRTIRRVATDGTITTVIQSDKFAPQSFLMGLAFDAGGDLYVADPGNLEAPYIWKVDTFGTVTRIAGTGVFGSTGNGGLALAAEIEAAQIAVGPHGDLYFDDVNGYRTIDKGGVIRGFAGTGVPGFSGDGGPAIDATIGVSSPVWLGVAADTVGNVYLGDPSNYRIRKVDPAGVITTVAGTGVAGYAGDGGPATQAMISSLSGLAVDQAGDLYLADTGNNVVRKIDSSGAITTVAGSGQAGFSGDCGPATSTQLNQPTSIAVHDGVLYIVDSNNNRIRMVVP